jgi:hypothetical protein
MCIQPLTFLRSCKAGSDICPPPTTHDADWPEFGGRDCSILSSEFAWFGYVNLNNFLPAGRKALKLFPHLKDVG